MGLADYYHKLAYSRRYNAELRKHILAHIIVVVVIAIGKTGVALSSSCQFCALTG